MRFACPIVRLVAPALACAGFILSAQPAVSQEVKLNEVLRSLFYAPQYVAVRTGAFEQEGLKVVGPKTTWGVQATLTEIISGNSNIALLGPEAALLTQDAGPERRLVNFAQLTNGDGGFILSKIPMPNFTIADLKGKTIVTSGKGSTPALVLVASDQEGGARSQQGRDHPQHSGVGQHHPLVSRAEHAVRAGVRADDRAGGRREQRPSRRLGRHAARPDALYGVHGAGELHRENPAIVQAFTNAVYRGLIWTELIRPRRSPSSSRRTSRTSRWRPSRPWSASTRRSRSGRSNPLLSRRGHGPDAGPDGRERDRQAEGAVRRRS